MNTDISPARCHSVAAQIGMEQNCWVLQIYIFYSRSLCTFVLSFPSLSIVRISIMWWSRTCEQHSPRLDRADWEGGLGKGGGTSGSWSEVKCNVQCTKGGAITGDRTGRRRRGKTSVVLNHIDPASECYENKMAESAWSLLLASIWCCFSIFQSSKFKGILVIHKINYICVTF